MKKIENLAGKKFNMLTVIEFAGFSKSRNTMWLCECQCGNLKVVKGSHLKSNHTKSCGCHRINACKKVNYKHGNSNKRLYATHRNIINRCLNTKRANYKDYGGRGISICKEWLNSYEEFEKWSLENGYSDNLCIDRIDNDGEYSPQNCRWVTNEENCQPGRRRKRIDNTTGYIGVSYNKGLNKYRAKYTKNKITKVGPYRQTIEDAYMDRIKFEEMNE